MPADNENVQPSKTEQLLARLNDDFGSHSNEKFGMMGNLLEMQEEAQGQQEAPKPADPVRTPPDNKQIYEEVIAPLNSSIQEMKRQNREQFERLQQAQQQQQAGTVQHRQVQILPDGDVNDAAAYGHVKELERELLQTRSMLQQMNGRLEKERAVAAYDRLSNKYKDQGFSKEMPIEDFQRQFNDFERKDPGSLSKINWDAWLDQSFKAVQGTKASSLADENAALKKEIAELKKNGGKQSQADRNQNLVPRSTISTPTPAPSARLDSQAIRSMPSFRAKGDGSFARLGNDILKSLGV